jgi:hypothetical protein
MGRAPSHWQTLANSHYLCQLRISPIRPGRASLFGQTLTKLRSNEAMVMLAELKLHMRDKYKQNDAAKARLKRHASHLRCSSLKLQLQLSTTRLHRLPRRARRL